MRIASPVTTRPQTAPAAAPLRGTQSFVGVMAGVWRRPGLTAIEVLWRWLVGVPFLLLLGHAVHAALRAHPVNVAALQAMTVFEPAAALQTLGQQIAPLLPALSGVARRLLPMAFLAWIAASTAGRLAIWRRLDASMPLRPVPVAVLGLARMLVLLAFLWGWVQGIGAAARYSITSAVRAGGEPNLVLFTAIVVVLSLALFLLWCLVVWPFDAAPLFALVQGKGVVASLRSALGERLLRSKLVEIDLVMGIVKVGLLVLAMVFSATPLPFAAEETQGFLFSWWSFVGVLFLLALDFFHVVRRAANLSFFRTLVTPKSNTETRTERAY